MADTIGPFRRRPPIRIGLRSLVIVSPASPGADPTTPWRDPDVGDSLADLDANLLAANGWWAGGWIEFGWWGGIVYGEVHQQFSAAFQYFTGGHWQGIRERDWREGQPYVNVVWMRVRPTDEDVVVNGQQVEPEDALSSFPYYSSALAGQQCETDFLTEDQRISGRGLSGDDRAQGVGLRPLARGNDLVGRTLGHELGHYLGVQHVHQEYDPENRVWDTEGDWDRVTCARPDDVDPLNLMATSGHDHLTPGQWARARQHCFHYRADCIPVLVFGMVGW